MYRRSGWIEFLLWIACFVLCVVLFVIFLQVSHVNRNSGAGFKEMLSGEASRPFVYRTLVPTMVGLISDVFPENIHIDLDARLYQKPLIRTGLNLFNVSSESIALESVIAWGIMLVSLMGFAVSLQRLVKTVYLVSQSVSLVVTLVALAALPIFFMFGYIYDFTTLFLFTICFWLLAENKWGAYLLFYSVACINKETSILLLVVFVFHALRTDKLKTRQQYLLVFSQIVIYLSVRMFLTHRFSSNSGGPVQLNLFLNIQYLQEHPLAAVLTALSLFVLLVMMFSNAQEKPACLISASVLFPILLGTMLPFGYPNEIRVFYEVYPVLIGLCAHTILTWLNIKIEAEYPEKALPDQRWALQLH
jgi:hypothetical protein